MKCDICQKENGLDRREWCEHLRARYEEAYERISAQLAPLQEAIRESERLTADDLNTRINCIPD